MASPWIYRELDIYEASSKIQSNVQRKSTYKYISGSKTENRVLTGMVQIGITFPISDVLLFLFVFFFIHQNAGPYLGILLALR